jgi:hypothetical protein
MDLAAIPVVNDAVAGEPCTVLQFAGLIPEIALRIVALRPG